MAAEGRARPGWAAKDGREWRIGTDADVVWIRSGTGMTRTIDRAIPLRFEAYATIVRPDGNAAALARHEDALAALLTAQSPDQPWWLGYLDTGADDIVFPAAPLVTLYWDWHYVLVEAGPDQAATWRSDEPGYWIGRLPNLIFPADRSWLLSTLWDDDWTCAGGPAGLIGQFLRHPSLDARAVLPGQDSIPPGHDAV